MDCWLRFSKSSVPSKTAANAAVPGQQDTDVAGKTGDTVPGTPSESAQQTPEPQAPTDPLAADPTEAELKRLKPETRKRFERLLQQRDEARTAYSQVEPELAQHRQLTGYLREHQLAPDDVNMLLGVGAHLRKGDFQSFLNGVMPYVQAAQEALGQRLPPDLQQQVDEGLVSESAARELSQTRFRAIQAENQIKAARNSGDSRTRSAVSPRSGRRSTHGNRTYGAGTRTTRSRRLPSAASAKHCSRNAACRRPRTQRASWCRRLTTRRQPCC
jgi:hypothetical protein